MWTSAAGTQNMASSSSVQRAAAYQLRSVSERSRREFHSLALFASGLAGLHDSRDWLTAQLRPWRATAAPVKTQREAAMALFAVRCGLVAALAAVGRGEPHATPSAEGVGVGVAAAVGAGEEAVAQVEGSGLTETMETQANNNKNAPPDQHEIFAEKSRALTTDNNDALVEETTDSPSACAAAHGVFLPPQQSGKEQYSNSTAWAGYFQQLCPAQWAACEEHDDCRAAARATADSARSRREVAPWYTSASSPFNGLFGEEGVCGKGLCGPCPRQPAAYGALLDCLRFCANKCSYCRPHRAPRAGEEPAPHSCTTDSDCKFPGCDQPDLVTCSQGTCVTGTKVPACANQENGHQLGDGGWCYDGRRDIECPPPPPTRDDYTCPCEGSACCTGCGNPCGLDTFCTNPACDDDKCGCSLAGQAAGCCRFDGEPEPAVGSPNNNNAGSTMRPGVIAGSLLLLVPVVLLFCISPTNLAVRRALENPDADSEPTSNITELASSRRVDTDALTGLRGIAAFQVAFGHHLSFSDLHMDGYGGYAM